MIEGFSFGDVVSNKRYDEGIYDRSKCYHCKESLTGFYKWESFNVAKCIIPDDQWDGDTGIPELLERYYAERGPVFVHGKRIPAKTRARRHDSPEIIGEVDTIDGMPRYFDLDGDMDTDNHKLCPECGRILPNEYFGFCAHTDDQLQEICRECRCLKRQSKI